MAVWCFYKLKIYSIEKTEMLQRRIAPISNRAALYLFISTVFSGCVSDRLDSRRLTTTITLPPHPQQPYQHSIFTHCHTTLFNYRQEQKARPASCTCQLLYHSTGLAHIQPSENTSVWCRPCNCFIDSVTSDAAQLNLYIVSRYICTCCRHTKL